jgi:K+-transporting ATPase ATPase C chain
MRLIVRSILYLVVLTALCGGVYPAAVLAVGQLFWPNRANGSFVAVHGRVLGSELIGQNFRGAEYLHPRPSAAGPKGYDATSSRGTNRGPENADLVKAVAAAVADARRDRPGDLRPVPADLVTSSGSGLDPHISPEAAFWQAARVAKARGTTEERVLAVIRRHIEPRTLGFLGEPRINVLLTNLDLDRSFPRIRALNE